MTAPGMALPLLLLASFAGQPSPQTEQPYQIAVNVNLVVLNATVQDRKGRFASDLHEQDFEIYEDGVRQSMRLFRHEDIPVAVGLVVDHSGSMLPKLSHVIAAARTFVEASSPEDQMFVVNFNEHVSLGLPDGIAFSNRPDELARAIFNTPATGQTALYDAFLDASKRLQTADRDKKVLIVISDGGDNASAHSLADVLKMAAQSAILVYTIGIFDDADEDRNPDVLRRLAHGTGGEAYFPARADEAMVICERIARDIRHQYTLGYVSSNLGKAGYRMVQVIARRDAKSKLVVRTRSGYFAAGAAQ